MQLTHPTGDGGQKAPVDSPGISPVVWGVLFIVGGVFALLLYLGFLPGIAIWGIGLFFAAVALVFLYLLLQDTHEKWWAALPAMTLLGLAGLIVNEGLGLGFDLLFGGASFLGWIGTGFLIVFAVRRDLWWALIPAGVLITLAGMTHFTEIGVLDELSVPAFLFLGIGITFFVVGMYKGIVDGEWWALIPALVLLGMGILFATDNIELLASLNWLWPVVLIAVGCWIVYRALARQRGQ